MLTAAITPDLPRTEDLRDAPELAAIHLLQTNIELLGATFKAIDQHDPHLPVPDRPRAELVRAMLPLMNALQALLLEYRRALFSEWYDDASGAQPSDDDEIPY